MKKKEKDSVKVLNADFQKCNFRRAMMQGSGIEFIPICRNEIYCLV